MNSGESDELNHRRSNKNEDKIVNSWMLEEVPKKAQNHLGMGKDVAEKLIQKTQKGDLNNPEEEA